MTPPRGRSDLTGRQRDVTALVARGLSNKEIGYELGIALQTVKDHLRLVFLFTGVENRTELAMWWMAQHADPLEVEPEPVPSLPWLLMVAVVMAQALDAITFAAMPSANELNPLKMNALIAEWHSEAAWVVKALLVVLVLAIQPALRPRYPAVGEAVALLAVAAGCIGAGSNIAVLSSLAA